MVAARLHWDLPEHVLLCGARNSHRSGHGSNGEGGESRNAHTEQLRRDKLVKGKERVVKRESVSNVYGQSSKAGCGHITIQSAQVRSSSLDSTHQPVRSLSMGFEGE